MARALIGCSGFSYKDWRGNFYPGDMPGRNWLTYYSGIFPTVELNVTFYRLPAAEVFAKWYGETPAEFSFALKGSRIITHLKRLKDVEVLLERFFARALILKEKLTVVLWQFPSSFTFDREKLEKFLVLLDDYPVWNAFEFRSATWVNEEVPQMCKTRGVALCMADWPGFLNDLPITAGFAYLRRHGEEGGYASCYSHEALQADARRIRGYVDDGLDVFVYFNNDAHGYAPANASELMGMLMR